MRKQQKLDCPFCYHPRLTHLSDHLIHSHNISDKERKDLLRRACFSVLFRQPEQPHPSVPQLDSTPGNAQAFHGLAPKCKLINMHELINKSTNDYVTLLPCENGANVNNKG